MGSGASGPSGVQRQSLWPFLSHMTCPQSPNGVSCSVPSRLEARIRMPPRYSADDLRGLFDSATLSRARALVLLQAVSVTLEGDVLAARVDQGGVRRGVKLLPRKAGKAGPRVPAGSTAETLGSARCSCQHPGCVHIAATLLAALERFPQLRAAEQPSLLAGLADGSAPERRRLAFVLSPSEEAAAAIEACWIGEASGRSEAVTPRRLSMDPLAGRRARELARALGAGEATRTAVQPATLAQALPLLLRTGSAYWRGLDVALVEGPARDPEAGSLPPGSAVLTGAEGAWYVDGASGALGRIQSPRPPPRLAPPRHGSRPAPAGVAAKAGGGRAVPARRATVGARTGGSGVSGTLRPATELEAIEVERPLTPVLRLSRVRGQDELGRPQGMEALQLTYAYGADEVGWEEDGQFLAVREAGLSCFVRRDAAAETAAIATLTGDGFVQMRIEVDGSSRGARVFVLRGDDAAERWHVFLAARVPALVEAGWRAEMSDALAPVTTTAGAAWDLRVTDRDGFGFSLDPGIEIDGVRHPLLPILERILQRGGYEAARVTEGELITSLPDGRVLRLPAERIRRLLAIIGDLVEGSGGRDDGGLALPKSEASTVLELEDLLAPRFEEGATIEAYVGQLRGGTAIPDAVIPAGFRATLRDYQLHGVAWLQHLARHGLGGLLADDMGLGKTAQTIAHVAIEHAAGRLAGPALIVVPTSLVANWQAEFEKFAPHLSVTVLHGADRHRARRHLAGTHAVITTYTVLARDIAEMRGVHWPLVVLDEAQAIKSPDAKATRAVCQLRAGHRVCLSGTPIENNLGELWSQFAFLMPELLGERAGFQRRFRTPIEKRGDPIRRTQLVRRIRPFILRRTKGEVATELPPRHTILRRVTLAPEQLELYEMIRASMSDRVREQVAVRSLAQSRIVVLDALLKLRQACCDPRLVKLASGPRAEPSSKLETLIEMMEEMIPEGRRILLFSQFTSMLDLIKPRLMQAGIPFVELRGDTVDRALPVRRFEAGEVPVFLISLKAGGRGLNLISADTVIHYDPWWNPAVEDQASDRAHRIGQTKSVFVYKLIAADTVEERILDLQRRKAELAQIALSDDAEITGGLGSLDQDDVDFLFGNAPAKQAA